MSLQINQMCYGKRHFETVQVLGESKEQWIYLNVSQHFNDESQYILCSWLSVACCFSVWASAWLTSALNMWVSYDVICRSHDCSTGLLTLSLPADTAVSRASPSTTAACYLPSPVPVKRRLVKPRPSAVNMARTASLVVLFSVALPAALAGVFFNQKQPCYVRSPRRNDFGVK